MPQSRERPVEAAAANGGTGDVNPVQDHGFMHGRDRAGPDGHVWGDPDGLGRDAV